MSYYTSLRIEKDGLVLPADFFERQVQGNPPVRERISELIEKKKTGDITLNELDELNSQHDPNEDYTNKYGFKICHDPCIVDYWKEPTFLIYSKGNYGMVTDDVNAHLVFDGRGFVFSDYGGTHCNHGWVQKCYEILWQRFKADVDAFIDDVDQGGTEPLFYRDGERKEVRVTYEIVDDDSTMIN